jgi:hypothetical protein
MAWRTPVSKREHASPTASAIFVGDLANQVFGGPSRPDDKSHDARDLGQTFSPTVTNGAKLSRTTGLELSKLRG